MPEQMLTVVGSEVEVFSGRTAGGTTSARRLAAYPEHEVYREHQCTVSCTTFPVHLPVGAINMSE